MFHSQGRKKQIILIRHGEKDVAIDPIHLSKRGMYRAYYLIDYFQHTGGELSVPQSIYAMKQHSFESSNRCVETVEKLSSALGVPIHADYTCYEVDRLIECIQNDPASVVLVCWEHNAIPMLARMLGFTKVHSWGFSPLDMQGDNECFSATWVLEDSWLHVYHQFELDEKLQKYYPYPRNKSVCTITSSKHDIVESAYMNMNMNMNMNISKKKKRVCTIFGW